MQRAVVLLLAAVCLALCGAHPHSYQLEKDFEKLEEGLDSLIHDEEEDEEESSGDGGLSGEDPVVDDTLLIALDCGSSGTKLELYAKKKDACPGKPSSWSSSETNTELCTGVKFLPTMSEMDMGKWISLFAKDSPTSPSRFEDTGLGSFTDKVVGSIAFATAGNRIIDPTQNKSAWTDLTDVIGSAFPHVNWKQVPETIPGTHEAFLEYRQVDTDFFSMGGASAQAGFVLDNIGKLTRWSKVLKRADGAEGLTAVPNCYNQQKTSDFFTTIKHKATSYKPIARSDLKSKCTNFNQQERCVGLVSFLAGKFKAPVGSDATLCPTEFLSTAPTGRVHHWIGGVEKSLAIMEDVDSVKASCWGSDADAQDCARQMVLFARQDSSMENIRRFVQGVQDFGGSFSFKIIAALEASLGKYKAFTSVSKITAALKSTNGKTSGTARFGMFGAHGLLQASWVLGKDDEATWISLTKAGLLETAKASWIASAATLEKFPVPCAFWFKKEDNYNEVGKEELSCKVDLDRSV